MTTFVVTRKSDGVKVYDYSIDGDAPVEWLGMEFATHNHTPLPPVPPPPPPTVHGGRRTLSRLEFLRLLTTAERVAIRTFAKSDPVAEDFMALLDAAEEVNLDNADVSMGLTYLRMNGMISQERVAEVLRG